MLTALSAIPVNALQPIDTLNTTSEMTPDASGDYAANGAGHMGDQNFPTDTAFDIRFNRHGGNLRLDSFDIDGITFMRLRQADQLIVRRFGNAQANPRRYRWYGEAVVTEATIDVSPSRVDTPDDILAGNIINRGVLDTFLNIDVSGEGINTIERIDVLFTAGLVAPRVTALNRIGFAVAESNGNNPFQIAAITAMDGDGNPTAYGDIVLVTASDYGVTDVIATHTWFDNDPFNNPPGFGGHDLPRPYGGLTESTHAVFISFQDLGIVEGQTFFGYSLFADDVAPGTHDLTDVSTFPQHTTQPNGGDHVGGFMQGLFASPLPPVAVDDRVTTPVNAPVTFSATDNDTDLDDHIDPSTVDLAPHTLGQQRALTIPNEGAFTVAANGDTTFAPATDFSGTLTIPYTVSDNEGFVSNIAHLTVTVKTAKTPPTAVDDSVTTTPDTPVTFSATDNDTDPDDKIDPGTVDLDPNTPGRQTTFVLAREGTFTVNVTGNVIFTPAADFTGTSSISYTVNDGDGNTSSPANLILTVADNIPPVAANDSAATPIVTPVTLAVIANDTDSDGTIDPATVDLDPSTPGRQTTFTVSGEGVFVADDNGNVTFTPQAEFNGASTASYTVNDDIGATSNIANMSITVGSSIPPIAANDIAITPVETPITLAVTTNDTDVDGTIDPATVDLDPSTPGRQVTFNVPDEGTFMADDSGNVTFTAEAGFTGTSTIPYTVNDDGGATSNIANIRVTVQAGNAPPVANDDRVNTAIDTPTTLSAITNDTDTDGTIDPASVDLDPNTPGRQTTLNASGEGTYAADDNGNVTFTPQAGFTGTSAIGYTINDNEGATSNIAMIAVTVNAPPVAADDSATTLADTPVTLSVVTNDTDNDGTIDPATVDLDPNTPGRQATFAVPGESTFTADGNGNVTMTPQAGFIGTSTAPYTVNDNNGATSNIANIIITVEAPILPNTPPIANDDNAITPSNTPVTIAVLGNDNDPDGSIDPATTDLDPNTPGRQTTVTVTGEGVFTTDDNGNVTLTPETDFVGTSTISYTVNDDDGDTSNTANLVVTVEAPINVPPTAVDDIATTATDTPVTIPVLNNDSDPDGDPIAVTQITQPESGVVTLNQGGTLTYTPIPDAVGPVMFTYTIADDRGGMDTATVTVNLTNVFDPPSGQKTVRFIGRPELEWRMVWINAGNVTANAVRVEDAIIPNTAFVNGSLTCEARGNSTVDRCDFEAAANRVVYEGVIAADPGATTEEQASNEVVITFRVTVPNSFFGPLVNQGAANWDASGNGSADDDIAAGQIPVLTNNPTTDIPGDGTSIVIPPVEDSTDDNEEGGSPDEGGSEGQDGF